MSSEPIHWLELTEEQYKTARDSIKDNIRANMNRFEVSIPYRNFTFTMLEHDITISFIPIELFCKLLEEVTTTPYVIYRNDIYRHYAYFIQNIKNTA
jgi:hypothetical protein